MRLVAIKHFLVWSVVNPLLRRMKIAPFCSVSSEGVLTLQTARRVLRLPPFPVPNLSGFYHGLLVKWFDQYGLGENCLLVSETHAVAAAFRQRYPRTHFVTTDLYTELQPQPTCDVNWDLCSEGRPAGLEARFSSVICQATLEHLVDPVKALRNLSGVLLGGGVVFLHTHTPGFPYHGYPRDYLRYYPDWFQDLPRLIPRLVLRELLCVDGHAFAVYAARADRGGA